MAAGFTRRTTAVLAVSAAVLCGCSDEQKPAETLPDASSSASTSSEALPPLGPSDFPMPAEARTRDAAGAEAFTRYYIDLINRTSAVMDAAPLREFSDGCADCIRIASDTEQDAAAGYHYEGGDLTVTSMQSSSSGSSTEVAFFVDQAALSVVDASGQPVPDLTFTAQEQASCGATMRWDAERSTWVLISLTLG
ncbi:DUF6318 family protein [Blastococcus sp. URHD0036]|uniref:DUF6318 family protein n=1 Tax=Blastococcus sp. URHD0036 TaxID=1380356 RepID=UPI000495E2F1|nr:DUF6318 family protein [Blastococcus sp. URHD0036]